MDDSRRISSILNNDPQIVNGNFKVDYINLHSNRNVYIHCNDIASKDYISGLLVKTKFDVKSVEKRFDYLRVDPVGINTSPFDFIKSLALSDNRFTPENSNGC